MESNNNIAAAGKTKVIKYQQLMELIDILNSVDYTKRDRFTYACQKIGNKLKNIMENYNERLADIDDECCLRNPDGSPMQKEVVVVTKDGSSTKTNSGRYLFDKAGRLSVRKKLKELMKESVEVPVYLAQQYEKNETYKKLTLQQCNVLSGIILPVEEIAEEDDEKGMEYWMNTAPEENPVTSENGAAK